VRSCSIKSAITISDIDCDQLDPFNCHLHHNFPRAFIRPQALLERFSKPGASILSTTSLVSKKSVIPECTPHNRQSLRILFQSPALTRFSHALPGIIALPDSLGPRRFEAIKKPPSAPQPEEGSICLLMCCAPFQ
jgi:hypothetical protein